MDRRAFLKSAAAGLGSLIPAAPLLAAGPGADPAPSRIRNLVLVRFGGGVRRLETIDPGGTYCPFFCRELVPRGVLFKGMEIAQIKDIQTSHGEGTLNILTGKYDFYKDIHGKFLASRFEAKVPTLFEYFRGAFPVPEHQTLIINGEDRTDEEFYSFSNHRRYGVKYRCATLSLYRFKTFLLRRLLREGRGETKQLEAMARKLGQLEALDYRVAEGSRGQGSRIERFWEGWRAHYGESGFVNPRGDRLLTEIALRALRELRPRLMMINYQDPDYVHWGIADHYTRAIAVIDEGLSRIAAALENDPEYRDSTALVVVPDCGRDSNPFSAVPFQHHFGSRSSHELFALFLGPGIPPRRVVDRTVQQIDVAPTIGRLMGFATPHAEGEVLPEVFG
jgi:hypothetical protein